MKSKTRRKLTFRRFAYYLLITAIVVSCVANGIFAKFTTEDDGGDGARVAKFGILLNIAGDLFATTYNTVTHGTNPNGPTTITEVTAGDTISVQASSNADGSYDNVLAPGTKSANGIVLQLKGSSEADFVLDYETSMNNIFLHIGETERYGVIVPLVAGTIQEHNFEEFKDTLYIITKTETIDEQTVNTYTKVSSLEETDPNANFISTTTYYQIEDEAAHGVDGDAPSLYTPLVFNADIKYTLNSAEEKVTIGYGDDYQLGSTYGILYHICAYTYLTGMENFDDFDPTLAHDLGLDSPIINPNYKLTNLATKGKSPVIETNTPIDTLLSIGWEWPYEQDCSGNNLTVDETHAYDTILGHIMAEDNVVKSTDGGETYTDNLVEGTDYNVNFEFALDVTANQVD